MSKEPTTCPLGHECYVIKDNIPRRCAWHIKLAGTDAQGNTHDEWGCAIAWLPILQLETSRASLGGQAAVESLRNETMKRMDAQLSMNLLLEGGRNAKDITNQ